MNQGEWVQKISILQNDRDINSRSHKKFSNCKHFVQRKPKHQLLGNWGREKGHQKNSKTKVDVNQKVKSNPANTPFPQIRPPNSPKPLYKTEVTHFLLLQKFPKQRPPQISTNSSRHNKQASNNCIIKSHPKFHVSATRPSIVQQFLQKQIKNHQIRPTIINVSGHMLISNEWIYFSVSVFQIQIGL